MPTEINPSPQTNYQKILDSQFGDEMNLGKEINKQILKDYYSKLDQPKPSKKLPYLLLTLSITALLLLSLLSFLELKKANQPVKLPASAFKKEATTQEVLSDLSSLMVFHNSIPVPDNQGGVKAAPVNDAIMALVSGQQQLYQELKSIKDLLASSTKK